MLDEDKERVVFWCSALVLISVASVVAAFFLGLAFNVFLGVANW